jgi:hypothetical protein
LKNSAENRIDIHPVVSTMISVGREDRALLESNSSARSMAGNNRERLLLQGAPGPHIIKDCFLPKSEKLMCSHPKQSGKTTDFDKNPN